MKFRAKKDIFYSIVNSEIWNFLFLGFFLWSWADRATGSNGSWIFAALAPLILLLFQPFERTSYELTSTHLKYRRGIFRGAIALDKIKEIRKNRTVWMSLKKPATARNGLVLKYGNLDDLYISPESNDLFISEILKLNSNIKTA